MTLREALSKADADAKKATEDLRSSNNVSGVVHVGGSLFLYLLLLSSLLLLLCFCSLSHDVARLHIDSSLSGGLSLNVFFVLLGIHF